jgi:hypothetical protein
LRDKEVDVSVTLGIPRLRIQLGDLMRFQQVQCDSGINLVAS